MRFECGLSRAFRALLVASALALAIVPGAAGVTAQEDQPDVAADRSSTPGAAESATIDPSDPLGTNAPLPVADQTVANWWDRAAVDWRIEPEIKYAYIHYWEVRSQALRYLDMSLPPTVLDGAALQRQMDALQHMRAMGQAEVLNVQHNYVVWEAVSDEGVVYDAYQSNGYPADPGTGKRLGPDVAPAWNYLAYLLQKPDGPTWKVVDAVRIGNHDEIPMDIAAEQTRTGQDDGGSH